jgi:serine/threonine protein kinase
VWPKVAIKLEPKATKKLLQLNFESKVYKLYRHTFGIPSMRWFGEAGEYNAMVSDLLGQSLESLFSMCGRRFSLKTVIMLAHQLLERIESVHKQSFIHRDLKPDNLLMGLNEKATIVHIVDFGLAKKYRDVKTLVHKASSMREDLTGTARYASINAQTFLEQTRRDDLESIGYILVYFLRGSLPWQGMQAKDDKEKHRNILESKRSNSPEKLCAGLPREFAAYLSYTRSLAFDESPDYSKWRSRFAALLGQHGWTLDWKFDWMQDGGRTLHK